MCWLANLEMNTGNTMGSARGSSSNLLSRVRNREVGGSNGVLWCRRNVSAADGRPNSLDAASSRARLVADAESFLPGRRGELTHGARIALESSPPLRKHSEWNLESKRIRHSRRSSRIFPGDIPANAVARPDNRCPVFGGADSVVIGTRTCPGCNRKMFLEHGSRARPRTAGTVHVEGFRIHFARID